MVCYRRFCVPQKFSVPLMKYKIRGPNNYGYLPYEMKIGYNGSTMAHLNTFAEKENIMTVKILFIPKLVIFRRGQITPPNFGPR